jgi:formylmethanofuran dehydrogenase subunit E
MFYTDEPIADFHCYDAEQQSKLDKLPRCSECDEPIQSETCYEINGELICEGCLENNHKKWIEDFIE